MPRSLSHDTKNCVTRVSDTDQAKAFRELTQNVRETTSDVSELEVGETTLNPFSVIAIFIGIPSGSPWGGKDAVVQLL